jgi:hypothetical protein
MEFVPAIAMLALIAKLIDTVKMAQARDFKGLTTQVTTWISGVLVLALVSKTQWASSIVIGDRTLDRLDLWSVVFVGLAMASGASLFKDTLRSVNMSGITQDTRSGNCGSDGGRVENQ